ncbi:orotidine-5'-phosphate decarboxylase [Geoalkalibacter sp.]|uniref:orotidine-5'-phosphate decarboxylase n=1 Tax=Geoalkalibacter sp. TaxID=3041440 RepID=UPI00272E8B76|nr:orotidine-5'-phosphate decarboxylase [Geoalkalibacter sp.]
MMDAARQKLIFALDVDSFAEAERWVKLLHAKVGLFKVGKQLFTRCGPEVVHMIRGEGGEVFLDLKYHDIPNTVAMASVEAMRLGARICNVHALGGREMMEAAAAQVRAEVAATGATPPLLLAVTILTSSTDATLREVGIEQPVSEMVPRLAKLAKTAGMGGVVASPQEIALIRAACGPDFAIVTPGVRPAEASVDDQKRIMTPGAAIAAGADYLVIGRPIARAADPVAAAEAIVAEMAAAPASR